MIINNEENADTKYKVLEASGYIQMGMRDKAFEIVNQLLLKGEVTFDIPRHLMTPTKSDLFSQQQTQSSSQGGLSQ